MRPNDRRLRRRDSAYSWGREKPRVQPCAVPARPDVSQVWVRQRIAKIGGNPPFSPMSPPLWHGGFPHFCVKARSRLLPTSNGRMSRVRSTLIRNDRTVKSGAPRHNVERTNRSLCRSGRSGHRRYGRPNRVVGWGRPPREDCCRRVEHRTSLRAAATGR